MFKSKYLLSFNIAKLYFHKFSSLFLILKRIISAWFLIRLTGSDGDYPRPSRHLVHVGPVPSPTKVTGIIHSRPQAIFIGNLWTQSSVSSYYARLSVGRALSTGLVWTCVLIYVGCFRHIFFNLWQGCIAPVLTAGILCCRMFCRRICF